MVSSGEAGGKEESTGNTLLGVDTPNGLPVVLVVVVGVHVATVEVQVVGVATIVLSSGPVVAVAAGIVKRAAIVVAGIRE